jgi:hypothetical protein
MRTFTFTGRIRQPLGAAERAGADAGALGEDHHHVAAREDLLRGLHRLGVGLGAADRESAQRVEDPALPAPVEQLALGHEVHRPAHADADHERVEEAAVVGGQDHAALGRHVLAADARHAEVQLQRGLQERAHDPVEDRLHAALAGAAVVERQLRGCGAGGGHAYLRRYPGPPGALRCLSMKLGRGIGGAIAGSLAAAIWAAQQPLDKRAFGCEYDDVEMLGKLVTRGREWPLIGLGMHMANGAVFGAVYSQVRPFLPGPPVATGLLAGMTEHVLSWPLVPLVDTRHPARGEMPTLWGSRNALLQATWRHALFGAVLGGLEALINDRSADEPPDIPYSSNGHGSLETAVTVSEPQS